jgi:hypothetical protein
MEEERSIGKPRTRWENGDVQRDALQILGIRGWRKLAEDRQEWRRFLRETRTQLYRHTWMEAHLPICLETAHSVLVFTCYGVKHILQPEGRIRFSLLKCCTFVKLGI